MMDNGESQNLCIIDPSDQEDCLDTFLTKPCFDSFKQIPKRNQTTERILKAIECEPYKGCFIYCEDKALLKYISRIVNVPIQ